jgi:hypothetical protein
MKGKTRDEEARLIRVVASSTFHLPQSVSNVGNKASNVKVQQRKSVRLFYHWRSLYSVKVYNKERCAVDVGTLAYWRTWAAHSYCFYSLSIGIVIIVPFIVLKFLGFLLISRHVHLNMSCELLKERKRDGQPSRGVCVCRYIYMHVSSFKLQACAGEVS